MTASLPSVLLVVFDEDLCHRMAEAIRKRDIRVTDVTSLSEALRHLSHDRIDLILFERYAPGGEDILEWLPKIRQRFALGAVATILLTDQPPSPEDTSRAQEVRAVSFAPRPVSEDRELRAVARYVERELRSSSDEPARPPDDKRRRKRRKRYPAISEEVVTGLTPEGRRPTSRSRVRAKRPAWAPSARLREEVGERLDFTGRTTAGGRKPRPSSAPASDDPPAEERPARRSEPAPGPVVREEVVSAGLRFDGSVRAKARRSSRMPSEEASPRGPVQERHHQPVGTGGSLDNRSVPEILASCFINALSGKLELHQGAVSKTIYLLGGYPVFVTSNQVSETLGEFLRRRGELSPDEHERVLARMKKSGQKMGHTLIEMRLLTPAKLRTVLTENLLDKLMNTFSWSHGDYLFKESTSFGDLDFSFSLSPTRIVIDGIIQQGSDDLIGRYLSTDPRTYPDPIENPLWESGDLDLGDQELSILALIDGERTVRQIIKESSVESAYIWRFLLGLYLLELIRLRVDQTSTSDGSHQTTSSKRINVVSQRQTKPPPVKQVKRDTLRVSQGDYYDLLGVSRDAPPADIHRAFRERIKPYQHNVLESLPDKQRRLGEEIHRKLIEAYLVLSDTKQRELYLADLESGELTAEVAAQKARERRTMAHSSPPIRPSSSPVRPSSPPVRPSSPPVRPSKSPQPSSKTPAAAETQRRETEQPQQHQGTLPQRQELRGRAPAPTPQHQGTLPQRQELRGRAPAPADRPDDANRSGHFSGYESPIPTTSPKGGYAGRAGQPGAYESPIPPSAGAAASGEKTPRELLQQARDALRRQHAQEAALMLRDAVRLAPDEPIYLAWSAWTLFWSHPKNNSEAAKRHIERALSVDPELPDAHMFLARILEYQGEFDKAQQSYFTAAKKRDAPPRFLQEAKEFETRLKEARRDARATNASLAEFMVLGEGELFRRWVLGSGA